MTSIKPHRYLFLVKNHGYALFVVLILLTLFLILSTSFSINVEFSARQTRTIEAQLKALNAADSGIQYALEAVRQKKNLPNSSSAARWNILENEKGLTSCFKIFSVSGCPANQLCIKSYGEVVRGACGDYTGNIDVILAASKLDAAISTVSKKEVIVSWTEAIP